MLSVSLIWAVLSMGGKKKPVLPLEDLYSGWVRLLRIRIVTNMEGREHSGAGANELLDAQLSVLLLQAFD